MPRNVSRSPHELAAYTLRFIFTLRACSKGRADSVRSYRVKEQILERPGFSPAFFFFIVHVGARDTRARPKTRHQSNVQMAAEKSAALFCFWIFEFGI